MAVRAVRYGHDRPQHASVHGAPRAPTRQEHYSPSHPRGGPNPVRQRRFHRDDHQAGRSRCRGRRLARDAVLRLENELFAAVMSISPEALARLSTAFEGPEESLGERVVRANLGVWEGAARDSEPLMAMLRAAIVNDQASAQLREYIQARLIEGISSRQVSTTMRRRIHRAGRGEVVQVAVVVGRSMASQQNCTRAECQQDLHRTRMDTQRWDHLGIREVGEIVAPAQLSLAIEFITVKSRRSVGAHRYRHLSDDDT